GDDQCDRVVVDLAHVARVAEDHRVGSRARVDRAVLGDGRRGAAGVEVAGVVAPAVARPKGPCARRHPAHRTGRDQPGAGPPRRRRIMRPPATATATTAIATITPIGAPPSLPPPVLPAATSAVPDRSLRFADVVRPSLPLV